MITNIELGRWDNCVGKHGGANAEYTYVSLWEDDADCSRQGAGNTIGGNAGNVWWLIQKENGQTSVNVVNPLATSSFPRGGQSIIDQSSTIIVCFFS